MENLPSKWNYLSVDAGKERFVDSCVIAFILLVIIIIIIWFVRLLALRPLLAYCASLG
jgi:hypothetical protein